MNHLQCLLLGVLFGSFVFTTQGQQDSLAQHSVSVDTVITTVEDTSSVVVKKHSPKKASILSAVLPGAGQFYNKKYWKIPLVYAALGSTFYFIKINRDGFKEYKQAYIYAKDDDPTTVVTGKPKEHENQPENLKTIMEGYRRQRDLSAILFVTAYLLNILDASIDAHFYNFDISDDLSLEVYPYDRNSLNLSLGVTFAFKL